MLLVIISLFFGAPEAVSADLDSIPKYIQIGDSLPDRSVVIDNVFIVGNNKTKDKIIWRELSVAIGETYTYSDLKKITQLDRDKIYNTRLFNTVEVNLLDLSTSRVDLVINLRERWYLFAVPEFNLVDRNFNDWWENHNHDIKRVNLGVNVYHFNMRGLQEQLKLKAQVGFARQFELKYSFPYIESTQRNGLEIFNKYTEHNSIAYNTVDHKQQFIKADKIIKRKFFTGATYTRRNSFFDRHYVTAAFFKTQVEDTVLALNSNFLANGQKDEKYFELQYSFVRDKSDIQAYPLHGYAFRFNIKQQGIGVFNDLNQTNVVASYSRYIEMPHKFFFSNYTSGSFSLSSDQPYEHIDGLGFGFDVLRGYELVVVEGQNYVMNKTTLKKQLAIGEKVFDAMPLEQLQRIPYAFYLKYYVDLGYVQNLKQYEQNSRLTGKLLLGTGVGLDIVTFYDLVVRLEYTFNIEGDNGFFLHVRKEF